MTSINMIDACLEISNAELGVLAARCPHCQGHFEIQPAIDRIDVGYSDGNTVARFDVALSLSLVGLVVERGENPPSLALSTSDRRWVFLE